MSIFPKRVTYGENVIIHFKINSSNKPRFIEYSIDVFNPNGEKKNIVKKKGLFSNTVETYYCYVVNKNEYNIPGQYFLKTNLYINGRKIYSLSAEMDYFWIDYIKNSVILLDGEKCIELINMGDSEVPYNILDKNGTILKDDILQSKERIIIQKHHKEYYLKYGNNNIDRIGNQDEEILYKNVKLRWRQTEEGMEFYDEAKDRIISLNRNEAKVWLFVGEGCSMREITKGLSWCENLDNIIGRMLNEQIIFKRNLYSIQLDGSGENGAFL